MGKRVHFPLALFVICLHVIVLLISIFTALFHMHVCFLGRHREAEKRYGKIAKCPVVCIGPHKL